MAYFTQHTAAAERFPSSWREMLVSGVNSAESRVKKKRLVTEGGNSKQEREGKK